MTTPMNKRWLLLRGLSREQQHWGDFTAHIQQALPDDEFHYLDLPGCGDQRSLASPLSLPAIRQQLQHQCVERMIPAPFGIIGLSLGAMVALDWLAARADQVEAVVVINTSANNFPLHWRLQAGALWLSSKALFGSLAAREKAILTMVSHRYGSDPAVFNAWLAIQQQRPVSRATIVNQLIAAGRFALPEMIADNKALVLASEQDAMVASRCSRALAERYHWPLCVHPTAGHDLPLDEPAWVVAAIKHWLLHGAAATL